MIRCSFALALFTFLSGPASATESVTLAPDTAKAFFDAWLPGAMAEDHVPGAVVVVVDDGDIIFGAGTGSARLKPHRDMNPARTLMRLGSISKLLTTVAVLQLVEQGKLDLQKDVREWVPSALLKDYPETVTLHQLLTHTAGVGDKFAGQAVRDISDVPDPAAYLATELQPPLARPGALINYSNQGIVLAALCVEKASGLSFADYAQQNIFKPLDMADSTFLPDQRQQDRMAFGYNRVFGGDRLLRLRHWTPYPASSLVMNGGDAATLMKALLDGRGLFAVKATGEMMRSRQAGLSTTMPGMAYGLWQRRENGREILWHTGHMPGHRTMLLLLPEENVGLFVYSNSDRIIYHDLRRDFLDRFFPAPNWYAAAIRDQEPGVKREESPVPTRDYAGVYRHNWYPRETFGKAAALMGLQGEEIAVRAMPEDSLLIGEDLYRHAGGAAWKRESDGERVEFVHRGKGITHLNFGGTYVYHRLATAEQSGYQAQLLWLCFFGFLGCGAYWAWDCRARCCRGNSRPRGRQPVWVNLFRLGVIISIGTGLAFFVGITWITAQGAYAMMQDLPSTFRVVLLLPLVLLIHQVPVAIGLLANLIKSRLAFGEWVLGLILLLTSSGALWSFHYWNLLPLAL